MVALAISCTKLENTPQFPKSDATFSATSSATSVTPTAADSVSNVITLNWTDPGFAVGLDNSKFVVMVGAMGKDFVSFARKDFSGVTTGALLGKEINAMALKFGGTIGQPITLDVKVVASQKNNNGTTSSGVMQVAVTPYGDLGLKAVPTTVVCTAANADKVGTVVNWTNAFNGYNGVKTYQLQYAKGGTSFASPTSTAVTGYSKTFSQLDLNKIVLAYGVAAGSSGTVDFRIKASNESGSTEYSNVVTVTVTTYVAYNSIGLIGDATAGLWDKDTDMYRADPINKPGDWTVTVYLTGGKAAKFRADDAWDNNWGATDFPTGTGTSGGPNIPVANSGYYKVDFNAGTGAYTFTALTIPVVSKISVIGSSTPGGNWTTDLELTQSLTNTNVWTGTVALTAGELKFRANDTWPGNPNGYNWGTSYASPTGLSGWATQSGGNIPIANAGNYFVYINIGTGEYFFGNVDNNSTAQTAQGKISLIGDFNGWPNDTSDPELIQDPQNPYKWSAKIKLTAGGAKLRANHAWTTSWGGSTFPNGVGTTKNDPNIPVTTGSPQITFNSATGEYTFTY